MKKCLLVLAATLISLVLLEAVLQAVRIGRDVLKGRRMGQLSQDRILGYDMKPGWRKGRIRINNLGFRGPDMEVAKQPKQYRIVVIGDSLPFGVTLNEEQVFPSLLQVALNAEPAPGWKVEVINASVGGYNITQYRELYRTRIRPLQPDRVVLSLCQNDFTPAGPYRVDLAGIVRGAFDEGPSSKFPDNVILVRKGKILVARLKTLAARLTNTLDAGKLDAELRQQAPTFDKGWDFGESTLDGLITDIQSDGAGLLILVFPYRFQVAANDAQSDAHLSRFLTGRAVDFIDFLGPFRQAGRDLFLQGDQLHFNVEGHRCIADALSVRLKPAVAGLNGAQKDKHAD